MKTVSLIRHAKSSWEHPLSDRERPLKKRGLDDCYLIKEYLNKINFTPNKVYSSPATRAFDTCLIICEGIDYPTDEIDVIESLYDFEGDAIQKFVREAPEKHQHIAIFGHNNALTNIINIWSNEYINIPTCSVVSIDFDCENWEAIRQGNITVAITPKELKL